MTGSANDCRDATLQLPPLTPLFLSSRYGFIYVRPTTIAFEASARLEERETHRRLSMSGERRRLAVAFPVKFSMQGKAQWSAAFLRDGYCIVTATLHLWNRSVFICFALIACDSAKCLLTLLTLIVQHGQRDLQSGAAAVSSSPRRC